ncbi:hypothetical protein [Paludisphaera sp.]|uniref:hypothetical protein n=1 Tax=Paludisphaera sp. TaxID=2017432 RepID=UPI00301E4978
MENDDLLEGLAERYRRQGYKVTVRPDRSALPPFARDYTIELMAEGPGGNVLVSAKPSAEELARDESIADLADVVEKKPGWRFDLALLGPPAFPRPARQDATDMTRQRIEETLGKARSMYDGGFEPQAVVAAWSALESAMRHRLRSMGREAGFGTPAQGMLSALISAGEIDHAEFHDLEDISRLRNVIVHGFEPPPIGRDAIELTDEIARRLLNEIEMQSAAM